MYTFNKMIALGQAKSVARHNSAEAKKKRQKAEEKAEAASKKLYKLINDNYIKVTYNCDYDLVKATQGQRTIALTLKVGTQGRVLLVAYCHGYNNAYCSVPLILGFVNQSPAITLDEVRRWRKKIRAEIMRLK